MIQLGNGNPHLKIMSEELGISEDDYVMQNEDDSEEGE